MVVCELLERLRNSPDRRERLFSAIDSLAPLLRLCFNNNNNVKVQTPMRKPLHNFELA